MDRKDFFFRQLVTEDDLNHTFDDVENADRNFALDTDVKQKVDNTNAPFSSPDSPDFNALHGGIVNGLNVSITGTNATVSAGTAYDSAGKRIRLVNPLTVSLAATGTTGIGQGGTPTGAGSASTTPAGGQFIWILLQIFFNRALSDPREDGNNTTVYFDNAESFQFKVKASNSSASPTMPGGDPGCIILGAFKINSSNVITVQDYSTRGDWLRTYSTYTLGALPTAQTENGTTTDPNFIAGTARQAIIKLRNSIGLSSSNYANHINQSNPQDRHTAKNIDFDATSAGWADGITPAIPSNLGGGLDTDGVQAAINTIVATVADTTTGQGGTKKIGGASITGSPITLAAGTLRSQLSSLLTGLNNHINSVSAAHAATAITATSGTQLTGANVQAQLTTIDALRFMSPFGNGSDGSAVITGVTTLSKDMMYENLTLNSGQLIAHSYVIRVRGTLTINSGIIIADSGGLITAIGPAAGLGSKTLANGSLSGGASGGNGSIDGSASGHGVVGSPAFFSFAGNGGSGADAIGSLVSNSGTSFTVPSTFAPPLVTGYMLPGHIFMRSGAGESDREFAWHALQGGAGGGGGSSSGVGNSGGGGGGGGGVVAVIANNVILTTNADIRAPGGAADAGSGTGNAGGGGGGGGGLVLLWYAKKLSGPDLLSSACCPGGAGGAGLGTGGAGASGAVGIALEYSIGYLLG
jgi:hypothetical protein